MLWSKVILKNNNNNKYIIKQTHICISQSSLWLETRPIWVWDTVMLLFLGSCGSQTEIAQNWDWSLSSLTQELIALMRQPWFYPSTFWLFACQSLVFLQLFILLLLDIIVTDTVISGWLSRSCINNLDVLFPNILCISSNFYSGAYKHTPCWCKLWTWLCLSV